MKKADTSIDYLIKITIAILVLALVFYLLFSNYIWDYLRNMPFGYKYDNKDKIVNLTKDSQIVINYYTVGVVVNAKDIKFCTNGNCNILRNSYLYIKGDASDGKIYCHRNFKWNVWTDVWIGKIENNKFWIDAGIFEENGSIYESAKDYLPAKLDLLNLDGAMYISGKIYRDKEVKNE